MHELVEKGNGPKDFSFQFPSNGKAHVHFCGRPNHGRHSKGFQFPSNGKAHVHSEANRMIFERTVYLFQFPSNGKAHVHGVFSYSPEYAFRLVSIPFKRESTCALFIFFASGRDREGVSIPFKRESTCARGSKMFRPGMSITVFQFPSNGKAYMHKRRSGKRSKVYRVSIPFKRESTCAQFSWR